MKATAGTTMALRRAVPPKFLKIITATDRHLVEVNIAAEITPGNAINLNRQL